MNSLSLRAVMFLLLFAVFARGQEAASTAPAGKIDPKEIAATLVPDKAGAMPGEPFYVSLVIKNNSKRDLILWVAYDYIRSNDHLLSTKKSRKIVLAASSKAGVKLPEFDWVKSMGMGYPELDYYMPQTIPASGSYKFRLFVPYWVVLGQAGSYTLTAETKLVFSLPPAAGGYLLDGEDGYLTVVPTMIYQRPPSTQLDRPAAVEADKSAVAIPMAASAAIEVSPLDKGKMDKITDGLLGKISAGETSSPGAREACHELLAIPDERAIPWLLLKLKNSIPKKMDDPNSGFGTWNAEARLDALHALSKFNTDAALDALKAGMGEKQAGGRGGSQALRGIVFHYLLQSPHPGAIPYLLTLRDSPDEHVRYLVAETLGTRVPPAQAIPILKEMANDSEASVSGEATFFLKKLSEK